MYIVTSKPKRMSEYSGLVHIVISPKLFDYQSDISDDVGNMILKLIYNCDRKKPDVTQDFP
jgi:hypothetical protein